MKILKILGITFTILLFGVGVYYFLVLRPTFKEYERVRNMEIKNIEISKLKNGKYLGEFSYGKNTKTVVEIEIDKGKITSIKIPEYGKTEYAKKAIKGIKKQILNKQKNKVDVIAGATTTSKAVLKSIENALKKGQKND